MAATLVQTHNRQDVQRTLIALIFKERRQQNPRQDGESFIMSSGKKIKKDSLTCTVKFDQGKTLNCGVSLGT